MKPRRPQQPKKLNPFEIHINKQKMTVLGQKSKNDRGLPGVSRAKAIKKRKETLLQEFKLQHKSNKFKDKRIGERNHNLTDEDKTMARFTAIRKKVHKKSIFNLADDEVLTHKGQTLAEIEKFDDPRSEDEESDEDKRGNLDGSFVGDAHFGGGVLKKTGKEGAKTHKELIDELIAESKKRKAEKQKTKEATLELTEKLDTEWKDLLPLVNTSHKKTVDNKQAKTQTKTVDDYDKLMRELKFEARGTVSDRLKTEEEIAKQDKERLEEMERDRLERMKGAIENDKQMKHRSADELDDDVVYESDPEYMLTYNQEGQSVVEIDAEINGRKLNDNAVDEGIDEEEATTDEEDATTEDDLSDLKETDQSSDEDETEQHKNQPIEQAQNSNKESAENELPHTFEIPKSYNDLKNLLQNETRPRQNIILERTIKSNHPSLSEQNKENLATLFAYLLQFLNDNTFSVFSTIAPHLYDLAHLDGENAASSIKDVIREKHDEYKRKPKQFPGPELLLFFKLTSLLFSTSDFRHPVVTPCFVFIEQMLNKCRVKTEKDVAYGLFLVCLVCEFTVLSKRFLPASINFLGGILHMAIPKVGVKLIKVNPPFTPTSSLLVMTEDLSKIQKNDSDLKLSKSHLNAHTLDEFKLVSIYNTFKLIEEFDNNYEKMASNGELFNDILIYLELLPTKFYPEIITKKFEDVTNQLKLKRTNRTLNHIVMQAKKPKALRLYEPKFQDVFDGIKRRVQSKEKAERDKLMYKLKKETKGALREIRRDKSFLGRVKIQERIQGDHDRRQKVKRIYSEAAVQQSELNNFDRKKKKKK